MTYDANGNMTSDGTNTYSWDAENRLLRITYPGVNNFTDFVYDSLGRNAKTVETTAGSVTSTKMFVWTSGLRREERDGAGALTKKFYDYGQINSTTKYFYDREHLSSIREMTDNAGAIQAQYVFDPYGQVTKFQGSQDSDFQFAGYYLHNRSGFNLTLYRAYSAGLARWLSRDPIGEYVPEFALRFVHRIQTESFQLDGATTVNSMTLSRTDRFADVDTSRFSAMKTANLYAYAENDPTTLVDPSGLRCGPCEWLYSLHPLVRLFGIILWPLEIYCAFEWLNEEASKEKRFDFNNDQSVKDNATREQLRSGGDPNKPQ